jgi:hypothetical protein
VRRGLPWRRREEMVGVRVSRPASVRGRWFGLSALAVLAGVLIPAALALACNPQAYLTLDKAAYAPGDSVRVSGSFFKNEVPITVTLSPTGQTATVTTSGNGAFSVTFQLAANAPTGGYSVQAVGYEADGSVTPGLPARGSLSVAVPVQTSTPGASQPPAAAPQVQASAPTPQQPVAKETVRPSQRPSSSRQDADFPEPSVLNEPGVQTSRTPAASTRVPAGGEGASVSAGRVVFGGSVAPAVSAPEVVVGAPATVSSRTGSRASRSSGAGAPVGRSAAERTAADDVWSALGTGRSPSVLPFAGDGVAVSSPRSGSQLALGLVLLGGGVLALVGGLAAGEARRRRTSTR